MGLLGRVKTALNRILRPMNMRLESRTADLAEAARLEGLAQRGYFNRPIFPVLEQFHRCDPGLVFDAVKKYESQLERFNAEPRPDQYSFANVYYASPDAEVLYTMVRLHKPRRIIEVGSGNSTLLFRQAITDGGLSTRLVSIDPFPRREIARHADEVIRERVEALESGQLFSRLEQNDILFIDSSHEIKVGNDVLHLFLNVLPSLSPGVIVHTHDIFLPFNYPQEWMVEHRWNWTEQYLLQALLQGSWEFEVLWAGHYFQKTVPRFADHFRFCRGADARSLWLRRCGKPNRE
jgi:predicted O-methyltransferase YrrM